MLVTHHYVPAERTILLDYKASGLLRRFDHHSFHQIVQDQLLFLVLLQLLSPASHTYPYISLWSTVLSALKELRGCVRWTPTPRLEHLTLGVVVAEAKISQLDV